MDIGKLSERSRLLRRLERQPDDLDSRTALARLYIEAGDNQRAASELMSAAQVMMARHEYVSASDVCRAALHLDPDSVELRLLLAQVIARRPSGSIARVAVPIIPDEEIVELTPAQQLEELDLIDAQGISELPLTPRDEVTRPPLPAAARASGRDADDGRDDATTPDEATTPNDASTPDDATTRIVVGPPEPEGGRPRAAPRRRSRADDPGEAVTLRIDVSADGTPLGNLPPLSSWIDEDDTSPTGHRAVTDDELSGSGSQRGFDRRRPAVDRALGAPAPRRVERGSAKQHGMAARLAAAPFVQSLSPELVATLTEEFCYCEYADGASIALADTAMDHLLIIASGVVRVLDPAFDGNSTDLARASEGEIIGAFECATGAPSRVAIEADGPVATIELARERLALLRRREPSLDQALRDWNRRRLLEDLLEQSPLFASLSPNQRQTLVAQFVPVEVGSSEVVFKRGDINRRLMIVESGELVVDGRGSGRTFPRLEIGPGDFFSYVATVLGRPSQVSVVATSPTTLLVLPEQEVYRLVTASKGIARAARREAVERGDTPVSILRVGGLGAAVERRPQVG